MSSRRFVPPEVRQAAIRDYYADTDATAAEIAARYGIARSTFSGWVTAARDDIALTGGRWVVVRGVKRWESFIASAPDLTDQQRRTQWEEAMFTEEEARDMHARYANGCREPRTRRGERVYQRRKKRAQVARKKAA